ncbi:MAG TPA: hypothetical protein VM940_11820 [Chthoniobacterales bacterium]|nr:hypothetical protein [Chthoniobacterales bacterium]
MFVKLMHPLRLLKESAAARQRILVGAHRLAFHGGRVTPVAP